MSPTPSPISSVGGVDGHAHIMQRNARLAPGRHSEPARDVSVEEFVGLLDAHGLSRGLLTQPSFYGTDNSLLLAALARYPARLRGTAIVAPTIPEAALADLQRGGICGVRLNWFHCDTLPDASGAGYQRLFGLVRELGLHVELYLEGARMAAVLAAIRRSRASIVIDHFGSPEPAGGVAGEGFRAVLDALGSGAAWVKLSAPYRLGGAPIQPYVDALLGAGGPEHLLWGSDWPWVSHEDSRTYAGCLAGLAEWIPDAAIRDAVLRRTPVMLFGFESDKVPAPNAGL